MSILRQALSKLICTALLAGCASTPAPDAVLTGTAWARQRLASPASAVVHAALVDVSQPDAPPLVLGRQRILDAGAPPYALHIPYRQEQIQPGGRYEVRVRVVQETRLYDRLLLEQDSRAPALWQPQYRHVDVLLRPVPLLGATQGAVAALRQTYWRLEEIIAPDDPGAAVRPQTAPGAAPAHLVLQLQDDLATGSGGCNRFAMRYAVQGEQLRFELVQAGMQLCLQGGSSERDFLRQLLAARSFMQQGQRLELRDATGQPLLRFHAQESGQPPLPPAPDWLAQ